MRFVCVPGVLPDETAQWPDGSMTRLPDYHCVALRLRDFNGLRVTRHGARFLQVGAGLQAARLALHRNRRSGRAEVLPLQ